MKAAVFFIKAEIFVFSLNFYLCTSVGVFLCARLFELLLVYIYINEKENFEIGKKPNIFVFYSNMFLPF